MSATKDRLLLDRLTLLGVSAIAVPDDKLAAGSTMFRLIFAGIQRKQAALQLKKVGNLQMREIRNVSLNAADANLYRSEYAVLDSDLTYQQVAEDAFYANIMLIIQSKLVVEEMSSEQAFETERQLVRKFTRTFFYPMWNILVSFSPIGQEQVLPQFGPQVVGTD